MSGSYPWKHSTAQTQWLRIRDCHNLWLPGLCNTRMNNYIIQLDIWPFFFAGLPTSVVITGNTSPYTTGDSATFSCDVTGGKPATTSYSWTLGGTVLSMENGQMLTLNPLTSANHMQVLSCTAMNDAGSVASSPTQTLMVQCEYAFEARSGFVRSFWPYCRVDLLYIG